MPYVYKLSPEVLERAKAELHEDPDRVESLIIDLRARLEETAGYHGRLDDEFLLRFIRYRKFNLEMAQERIVRYYAVRNEQPDIFTNFVPSSIAHMLQDGVVGVLANRDKEGRRVVIYRPGRWNYKNFPISDLIKTISIVNEYLMAEEETQVSLLHVCVCVCVLTHACTCFSLCYLLKLDGLTVNLKLTSK